MPDPGSPLTRGTFHYVDGDLAEPGFRFSFDPEWSGIPTLPYRLPVRDASVMADRPRFDREGFETVRLGLDAIEPRDAAWIETIWKPAVLRAVRELTGADAVACWAFGARFSERQEDAPRSDVSNPARRVHGDFSPSEFGLAIRHPLTIDAIAKVAPGRRLARWIGINAWQPVSPPPYDTPLAVCDTRTVTTDDLLLGHGSAPSMPELEIDLPLYRFSPRHRWWSYRSMAPDELLLFSGIDSAAPGQWRLVPHTAFDDPACPADAPPRNSIEMRTMALFFAD